MAAGNWTLTNAARTNIWNRYTGGGSALTFKCVLLTSSSNIGASSTTYAGLTGELTTANGYTSGGITVTLTPSGTTSVAISFGTNPVWTSTGTLTARTAAIVEASGNVFAYVTLDTTAGGTDVVVASGNTLTIDSDGSPSPVLTIA